MSQSPRSLGKAILGRASVVGVPLAIVSIIAFIGLWVLLGNAGLNNVVRLFLSLCMPPIVIAVLLGGYMMIFQRRTNR